MMYGQGGMLDTNFGNSGYPDATYFNVWDINLQVDGKIIASGYQYSTWASLDIAAARFNTDGSLDSTYGESGIAVSHFDTEASYSGAIQADGKLVLGGRHNPTGASYSDFIAIRYNTDGTLDETFGAEGVVIKSYKVYDAVNSVAVQPDGKLLLFGYAENNIIDFVTLRLNSDGSIDSTFGDNGSVLTNILYHDVGWKIMVLPSGNILAVGRSYDLDSGVYITAAQYNPEGSLDPGFGTGGIMKTHMNATSIRSAALQSDGKFVVAGYIVSGPYTNDFFLMRFNSNGSVDSSFGNYGIVLTDFDGADDWSNAIAIQTDNRIVVSGVSDPDEGDFAVARYDPNGLPDSTFGSYGKCTYTLSSGWDNSLAIELQADRKILVAGLVGTGEKFPLIRLLPGCPYFKTSFNYQFQDTAFQFFDQSTNAINWLWDFGDGTSSSLQNPDHHYASSGLFQVCLIANDTCETDTFCKTVEFIATQAEIFDNLKYSIQIHPNPVRETGMISFYNQREGNVRIEIIDWTGRTSATIMNKFVAAGNQVITHSFSNLLTGVYFLKLETEREVRYKKVIVQ